MELYIFWSIDTLRFQSVEKLLVYIFRVYLCFNFIKDKNFPKDENSLNARTAFKGKKSSQTNDFLIQIA